MSGHLTPGSIAWSAFLELAILYGNAPNGIRII